MMKYPYKQSESVDVEGNRTDNEKLLNYGLLSYYGLELGPLIYKLFSRLKLLF